MSNKKEIETRKVRNNTGSGGLGLNSTGVSGRLTRVASKTCSADNGKRLEESSAAAKRMTKGVVSGNRTGKLNSVIGSGWRPRASAVVLQESATKSSSVSSEVKRTAVESETRSSSVLPAVKRTAAKSATESSSVSSIVKRTAAGVAHRKTRAGRKEITQVPRTPTGGKRPDSPANKTSTKTAASQQVWNKKAQPESSTKEVTATGQQAQRSGSTSKNSTVTTESDPPTDPSKLKKSAEEQVLEEDCLPEDQSSRDKQVQGYHAEHKASTSKSKLETTIYHIKVEVNEEPDDQVGICCCLCEQDLGIAPVESNTESQYSTLPVVAILPCGHAFHNDCLVCGELQGQQAEPLCVFCES